MQPRFQLASVLAYAAVALAPAFWGPDAALVAYAVVAALVVALLARRRWAWWLLLIVELVAIVPAVAFGDALEIGLQLARIGLLLSPPVRCYVGGREPFERAGWSLLPGPPSKPRLTRAAVLLLAGALLAPFSIVVVFAGGPLALLFCPPFGLVALAVGISELNRWTRGPDATPARSGPGRRS